MLTHVLGNTPQNTSQPSSSIIHLCVLPFHVTFPQRDTCVFKTLYWGVHSPSQAGWLWLSWFDESTVPCGSPALAVSHIKRPCQLPAAQSPLGQFLLSLSSRTGLPSQWQGFCGLHCCRPWKLGQRVLPLQPYRQVDVGIGNFQRVKAPF